MNKLLLEIFAWIALIATFLGPIVLIWRLGLRVGLRWGILWCWLGLTLWIPLAVPVDFENYDSNPQIDYDGDFIGFFPALFVGFPVSLIYCGLLSILSLLVGALKATLQEIEANKKQRK
jgi:hypothetical protein